MSMFVSARFVSAWFTCACLLLVAPPALAGDPPIARALLAPELAALNDEELARIGAMSPLPALTADPTNRVADSLADHQIAQHRGRSLTDRAALPVVGDVGHPLPVLG